MKPLTLEEIQHAIDIQKEIPKSYRWGKWILLFMMIINFPNIHALANSPSAIFHCLIFYTLTFIGFIGLMKIKHKMIEIYATGLSIAFFGFLIFLPTSIASCIHEINSLSILSNMLATFFTNAFEKIVHPEINVNSLISMSRVIGFILPAIGPFIAMYYVIFNCKSRAWLKAKRITNRMLKQQNT